MKVAQFVRSTGFCLLLLGWFAPLWIKAQAPKPQLFVLSVGVSKYKNPKYNLKYAHKDALDLAEAWRKQTDLYEVQEVKTLINEQATRTNVRAALADFKRKLSPTGFLVFIFSGHGLNDALVMHEFDNEDRTATTLNRTDLTQQLSALGGNYIALLDACHSGSFAKNFGGGKDISDFQVEQNEAIKGLLRALSATDKATIVIGSSSSSEKSDECDACQNGYFTQCLLDAFDGKPVADGKRIIQPDVDGNGFIETNELDNYIKEAVFITTRANQISQSVNSHQTIGYNFPIVRPSNSTVRGRPVTAARSDPAAGEAVTGPAKSVGFQATNLTADFATDSDQDGVPDVFDQCRDQLGESRFWGCLTDPEPGSQWSQQTNGAIPTGAVSLGTGTNGKARFLARAGRHLGYIESGSRTAKIPLINTIVEVNVYDILHKGRFSWQSKTGVTSGRFVPVRTKGTKNPVVRTTYNGQSVAGTLSENSPEGRFYTGETKAYRSQSFQVLMDDEKESCRLIVSVHESVNFKPFYLYLDNVLLTDQGLRKAFTFPTMRTGKITLKAKYMELRSKGVFSNKFDTLWRTTPPAEFEAKPNQEYNFQLGRKWVNNVGQIVLADASDQEIFKRPVVTPNPDAAPVSTSQPNGSGTTEPSGSPAATVRIVRWKSPVTGDFESMPEGRHTDQQLQSWGFSTKTYQYSAYKDLPNDPNAIAVYRWTMPQCNASIMLGEHEISDAQLRSWGYKDKELQFYAYRTKPTTGDFVAVNRWINAKPQGDPCRDFTLTVAETELTDAQLKSYGYSGKTLQYYVPTSY